MALDPGDIHVGWALHTGLPDLRQALTGEWRPKEACRAIKFMIQAGDVDEIIMEEYRLYDRKYEDQAWSPFLTVQLIGAVKWIAEDTAPDRTWHCAQCGDGIGIHVHEQGATIKKGTRAQLPRRGIIQVGDGTHARDAELHLWKRVLTEMEAGRL